MKISVKHGYAFVCMPRCASTSIERVIDPYSEISLHRNPMLKHLRIGEYLEYIAPLLQTLFESSPVETFCLMRDPLAWIASWYRYRTRDAIRGTAKYTGDISYDEFIEAYVSEGVRPEYATIPRQSDIFALKDGSIGVDRIFPFEKLDCVTEFLSGKIGEQIELPRLNRSLAATLQLSPHLEEALRKHCADDRAFHASLLKSNGYARS